MRKFTVLSLSAFVVISLLSFSIVHNPVSAAQATPAATPNADCNPAKVFTALNTLKSSGDKVKDLQALNDIALAITTERILCSGFTFKGTGNKVLPPFVLPKGNYTVTVGTKQAFALDVKSLDTAWEAPPAGASRRNPAGALCI